MCLFLPQFSVGLCSDLCAQLHCRDCWRDCGSKGNKLIGKMNRVTWKWIVNTNKSVFLYFFFFSVVVFSITVKTQKKCHEGHCYFLI